MNWSYPPIDDSTGCRKATCQIGDDLYEYYGQWFDDQPSGLGAIRKNGQFFKASTEWVRGEVRPGTELTEEEYEKAMSSYQRQFPPYSSSIR